MKWKTEVAIVEEAENLHKTICRVNLMTEAGSSLTAISLFLEGTKTGDIEMSTDRLMNGNIIRIHKVSLTNLN